jgi:hypothetical protein
MKILTAKSMDALFGIVSITAALVIHAQEPVSFLSNGLVAYDPFNGYASQTVGNGCAATV